MEFRVVDIVKIIRLLEQNKANGDDEISIRMIKLCASLNIETITSDFYKMS